MSDFVQSRLPDPELMGTWFREYFGGHVTYGSYSRDDSDRSYAIVTPTGMKFSTVPEFVDDVHGLYSWMENFFMANGMPFPPCVEDGPCLVNTPSNRMKWSLSRSWWLESIEQTLVGVWMLSQTVDTLDVLVREWLGGGVDHVRRNESGHGAWEVWTSCGSFVSEVTRDSMLEAVIVIEDEFSLRGIPFPPLMEDGPCLVRTATNRVDALEERLADRSREADLLR